MATRMCPRCRRALTRARGSGMVLDICRGCGGTHFDGGELAEMTREHPDQLDDVERLVEPETYAIGPVASRGLPCADCTTPMETYEYAGTSGVLLDRCPKCHAVWADDSELQAIQDHIEFRADPATQGERALDPEVRVAMLLNDMRSGTNTKVGRLGALTSLLTALTRRPFGM